MMKSMKIETILNPTDEDLAVVNHGLHMFNLAQLGEKIISTYFKVLVLAKNGDNSVVGGISGEMYWDWLHIDTLWVDENDRGQGIGSGLLKQIESIAILEGFFGSHLETTDFQAVGFYRKNGYQIFGELEGKPKGHSWFYMKKFLVPEP